MDRRRPLPVRNVKVVLPRSLVNRPSPLINRILNVSVPLNRGLRRDKQAPNLVSLPRVVLYRMPVEARKVVPRWTVILTLFNWE